MSIFTVLETSIFCVSLVRSKESNKDEMGKAIVYLEILVLCLLDTS